MDSGTTVEVYKGDGCEAWRRYQLGGTLGHLRHSPDVKPGHFILVTGGGVTTTFVTSPYADWTWEHGGKEQFLQNERDKAQVFLRRLVLETKIDLGLIELPF